ncbi:hypothetical protein [Streptomyces sp. NPDC059761]|uniref:effector-associated constant component EACC1 n=1 Tax=Streptomyces sp. NPDC059761 TaxID=3346937 RepID=UPI003655FA37
MHLCPRQAHATSPKLAATYSNNGGGDLRVMLRIDGDEAEDDVRSLYEWLLLDRPLRREAQIGMASSTPPVAGHQGATLDLVSLVISSGLGAGSLGVAIATWRSTRPQEPTVTVELANGAKVTISGASQNEAQRLVDQFISEHH